MKILAGISFGSLAAGLVVALFALPVQAQNDAANGCWGAVTREARGMLSAGSVSRTSYSIAQLANAESLVTGAGQADGRPFSYRCTYNSRNGQAYAVSVSPEGGNRGGDMGRGGRDGDFGGNRPVAGGDPRKAAAQACYDAALDYAQQRNPTASNFKIFLSQNRYGQQSQIDIQVTGQGELRQMDRLRVQWNYSCTYNARNGRVRDISMSR